MVDADRASLRRQLRTQRQSLSAAQQRHASRQLARHILHHGLLKRHRHIGLYLPNDGEIDPTLLLTTAAMRHRHYYLPVLAPGNRLWFRRYRPGDRLKNNRFGIAEPLPQQPRRKLWSLGLVLVPLVGFDRQGGRLGMGGGFYDRSFGFKPRWPAGTAPRLIGVAHQCQELKRLTTASWDIALEGIVTDREVITAGNTGTD